MIENSQRKLLGKSRAVGSRAAVYQVADGLEIEVNEQYDVVHKRVLFDDVMLVTIHRELGALYLFLTGIIAALFFGFAILILSLNPDAWPAAIGLGAFGGPAFVLFAIRFIRGLEVVTVFGRRSKAALHFGSKRRAREVYGSICATVRQAHRHAAESSSQE